ncbi:glycoside hydrolase superfamily [Schizophyllum amplum]|uniref:chitinase n=1 Tax=Schizophyllum amplum TaxID=97359 RepID=A0A550C5S4_9AGAR|nr:glycoside hydrolase superfamily [Auriculariopsis ampla]
MLLNTRKFALLAAVLPVMQARAAFDGSRYDNSLILHSYWGQNSRGAVDGTDTANFQKDISFYCNDDSINVLPVSFLNVFFGTGGAPEMNLANSCNNVDNATFSGTKLPICTALADDIEYCQSKGKLVPLSIGGATGSVGFESDDQASTFAQTIWRDDMAYNDNRDMFLGGSSATRPFGSAVLDGVDLDIEGGSSAHYDVFVNKIRSLASGASKKYYVTAAPQCVYPDASLGGVLNAVAFDAVYVQFYNNQCGLPNYGQVNNWNFGIWDYWARHVSPNPNVKVYIGAPASTGAAGSGYVTSATLSSIATTMRKSFPSFGGVMLWDASQAVYNGNYHVPIKSALVAAGGTGFTYPACSAPAYASGRSYSGGSQVSYGGYIWQAKWYADQTPAGTSDSSWSIISACAGSGGSTTTTSPTTSPTAGNCAGVTTWSSSVAYTGGQTAVYNGHLWSAQWWTQGDTPGGSTNSGVWVDKGAC